MNSKLLQALDFGIDTRHVKFPLITQQESHTTSCNRNFECLNKGIKNRNFVFNRVGKSPYPPPYLDVLSRDKRDGAFSL